MAKLTEIFTNEETTATEKVASIAEVVAKAREKYGNEGIDIDVPEVATADGLVDLSLLSDSDKVSLAERAVKYIIMIATENVKGAQGVVLDRELERLIATETTLVNILASVDSDYI